MKLILNILENVQHFGTQKLMVRSRILECGVLNN